jgi:hypothetical protein
MKKNNDTYVKQRTYRTVFGHSADPEVEAVVAHNHPQLVATGAGARAVNKCNVSTKKCSE